MAGTTLRLVQPQNRLLIGSQHCESVTATVRNEAVNAIHADSLDLVSMRYLQSRQGQKVTRTNAIVGMAVPVAGWLYSYVNWGNTARMRKTKRACKAYLVGQKGPKFVQSLQKQSLWRGNEFLAFLASQHVNTDALESHRKAKPPVQKRPCMAPKQPPPRSSL